MQRFAKDLRHPPFLDHAAEVEDPEARGHPAYDRKIVSDKQIRQRAFLPQADQEGDDLCLR